MLVKIKKLNDDAVIPTYAHDGDIGMDLTAIGVDYDSNNDTYIYHTGLAVETPKHYGILLLPRSSNRRTDAYLTNHVGLVDSATYRGEIMLCFKNRTSIADRAKLEALDYVFRNVRVESFVRPISSGNSVSFMVDDKMDHIAREYVEISNDISQNYMNFAPYQVGERIAQMVVLPFPKVDIQIVNELSKTERGEGGFGSSGK